MAKVEIYKLQNDGTQTIVVACKLEDNKVICEGEDKIFIENLIKDGITDYSGDERNILFPKDGLKFLEQLKYNFKSGYLNASEIKE